MSFAGKSKEGVARSRNRSRLDALAAINIEGLRAAPAPDRGVVFPELSTAISIDHLAPYPLDYIFKDENLFLLWREFVRERIAGLLPSMEGGRSSGVSSTVTSYEVRVDEEKSLRYRHDHPYHGYQIASTDGIVGIVVHTYSPFFVAHEAEVGEEPFDETGRNVRQSALFITRADIEVPPRMRPTANVQDILDLLIASSVRGGMRSSGDERNIGRSFIEFGPQPGARATKAVIPAGCYPSSISRRDNSPIIFDQVGTTQWENIMRFDERTRAVEFVAYDGTATDFRPFFYIEETVGEDDLTANMPATQRFFNELFLFLNKDPDRWRWLRLSCSREYGDIFAGFVEFLESKVALSNRFDFTGGTRDLQAEIAKNPSLKH